jgi:hypothetical protein
MQMPLDGENFRYLVMPRISERCASIQVTYNGRAIAAMLMSSTPGNVILLLIHFVIVNRNNRKIVFHVD